MIGDCPICGPNPDDPFEHEQCERITELEAKLAAAEHTRDKYAVSSEARQQRIDELEGQLVEADRERDEHAVAMGVKLDNAVAERDAAREKLAAVLNAGNELQRTMLAAMNARPGRFHNREGFAVRDALFVYSEKRAAAEERGRE